jgi:hypothetical protein
LGDTPASWQNWLMFRPLADCRPINARQNCSRSWLLPLAIAETLRDRDRSWNGLQLNPRANDGDLFTLTPESVGHRSEGPKSSIFDRHRSESKTAGHCDFGVGEASFASAAVLGNFDLASNASRRELTS